MNLVELRKEISAMIAKHGGNTIVVRQDSQSWIKDINRLQYANIDGKEMVIIN